MSAKVLTPESIEIVRALGELGLIMLMVEVPWHAAGVGGRRGAQRAPALIAILGIVLSFFLGCVTGAWSKPSIAPTQPYWSYVIFCGIALSVTALPVLMRIIQERGGIDGKPVDWHSRRRCTPMYSPGLHWHWCWHCNWVGRAACPRAYSRYAVFWLMPV